MLNSFVQGDYSGYHFELAWWFGCYGFVDDADGLFGVWDYRLGRSRVNKNSSGDCRGEADCSPTKHIHPGQNYDPGLHAQDSSPVIQDRR